MGIERAYTFDLQHLDIESMREIISLHIGQAGVRTGAACWELFCLEHNITPQGQLADGPGFDDDKLSTFFSEEESGKYVPRCVFLDLETGVVDEVRDGLYRDLYRPEQIISGKEDAANIFARGYNTLGREKIDVCMEQIRKMADASDVQGFMIYHSVGGGAFFQFLSRK